uniref:Dual specificity phosphatase catalytic domain-containing protein n=1 Tax=viral metagenome TaxID=1070528 RepID=A0A6C0E6E2_9ZZZZ
MSNHYLIEFLPGLWITNNKALSEKFYQQKKLKEMIDCTKDLKFFQEAENYIEAIKHEIKKKEHQKLHQYLLQITEYIHQHLTIGLSLLIYDPDGVRKAPVILIAYLLRYSQLTSEQIIMAFNSKSKIPIQINDDFRIALKYFQDRFN